MDHIVREIFLFGYVNLYLMLLNLLMWAHYANSHKGFCIGYKFEDIINKFGINILPVIYSEEYSVIRSYKMFEDYDEFFLDEWRSKSIEWSYEKEWRLVGDYQKQAVKIRSFFIDNDF